MKSSFQKQKFSHSESITKVACFETKKRNPYDEFQNLRMLIQTSPTFEIHQCLISVSFVNCIKEQSHIKLPIQFRVFKQPWGPDTHFQAFQILSCKMVVNFQTTQTQTTQYFFGLAAALNDSEGCLMYITNSVFSLLYLFSL
jgi:hypothetical protein